MSLFKFHSLYCLFFLLISTAMLSTHKISQIVSYQYGFIDLPESHTRQLYFSYSKLGRLMVVGQSTLELVALHLSIVWMNAIPDILFDRSLNDSHWFKPIWYRRFVYMSELMIVIPTLIYPSFPQGSYGFVATMQIIAGAIIIYQFTWGCKFISQRLRSLGVHVRVVSTKADQHVEDESTNVKKLNIVADRIDAFSRKFRISGGIAVVLYFCYVVSCVFLRMLVSLYFCLNLFFWLMKAQYFLVYRYVSSSTLNNQGTFLEESANFSFSITIVVIFNFLYQCIFGIKKARGENMKPNASANINLNQATVNDSSPKEENKISPLKLSPTNDVSSTRDQVYNLNQIDIETKQEHEIKGNYILPKKV